MRGLFEGALNGLERGCVSVGLGTFKRANEYSISPGRWKRAMMVGCGVCWRFPVFVSDSPEQLTVLASHHLFHILPPRPTGDGPCAIENVRAGGRKWRLNRIRV